MKRVLWSCGGILLLLMAVGLVLPSRAIVERDVLIDAHPATVFALLNDFNQINKWSPMLDDDPNAQVVISGPPRGPGASLAWDGHIVGRGRQTIAESVPYERVAVRYDVPGQAQAVDRFLLSTQNGITRLLWQHEIDYGFNLGGIRLQHHGNIASIAGYGRFAKHLAVPGKHANGCRLHRDIKTHIVRHGHLPSLTLSTKFGGGSAR